MKDDARAFWDRSAARYDRSMAWLFGGPMPRVTALVAEAVRGRERVLELAAGTGLVSAAIAPVVGTLVATDYSSAMVERLSERMRPLGNVEARVLDIYALDETLGTFDAVVAANVLHLLPDLDVAMAAILRVLRPGGRLVVPTYLHDATSIAWVASRGLAAAGFPGQRRFTLDSLVAVVGARGLRSVSAEQVSGLIPIGFVAGEVVPNPTPDGAP